MREIELSFPPLDRRSCKVRVGAGVLDALVDALLRDARDVLVALVSDDNVASLHGAALCERLTRGGLRAALLTFPAGEASKVRATKDRLEDELFRLEAGRDTLMVAVGGGVTGDIAGFVASTWHRGVPLIQVPTSLVAMVDAALGGKTGVNLAGGKNLVGTFHQPRAVYADVALLSTLPAEPYVHGFAEVVKSAAVADAELFGRLELESEPLLRRNTDALEHVVAACLSIKAAVVAGDEREAGRRAMLNFGHTIGHALETASDYRLAHGPAVSIGLCAESRIAVRRTGFPAADADRVAALLARFGLPVRRAAAESVEQVLGATRRDKKARGGRVRYALPERLGSMPAGDRITCEVDEAQVREVLEQICR